MKFKTAKFTDQNGSTSIQWVIISVVIFWIIFAKIFNEKSAALILEDTIKMEYRDQVFSGSLP